MRKKVNHRSLDRNKGISLNVGSTKNLASTIILEYSHSQKAFHTQTLLETIEKNLFGFITNKPGDYIILGAFADRGSCDVFYRKMVARLNANEQLSPVTFAELMKSISP